MNVLFFYGEGVDPATLVRTLGRDNDWIATRKGYLPGRRRTLGVALDNRSRLEGQRVFLNGQGNAHPGHVAFFDLRTDANSSVHGVFVGVSDAELQRFDGRERNYMRIDVTAAACIEGPALREGTRVWVYVGTHQARQRFSTGQREGNLAVSRSYLEAVRSAYAALGEDALAQFEAETDPISIEELSLREARVPVEVCD